MYKKFGSTAMVVAKLLGDRHKQMLCKVIVTVTQPLLVAHTKEPKNLRAPKDVLEYSINYASGSYTFVLRKVMLTMYDVSAIAFVGLNTEATLSASLDFHGSCSSSSTSSQRSRPEQVAWDGMISDEAEVASSWFLLAATMMRARLLSMMHWTDCFPGQFAPLLSESVAVKKEYLKVAKDAWEAITEAERLQHTSVSARELLQAALPT